MLILSSRGFPLPHAPLYRRVLLGHALDLEKKENIFFLSERELVPPPFFYLSCICLDDIFIGLISDFVLHLL